MKRLLLILSALCLYFPVFAEEDSGAYFDMARNGDGAAFLVNGDTFLFFLFTYGGEVCSGEPVVSPALPNCTLNGQRWFFGVSDFSEVTQSLTGNIFVTEGIDYPFGFEGDVGMAEVVGRYTIVKEGTGFLMFVTRFGTALDEDDPLFSQVINLSDLLFRAVD